MRRQFKGPFIKDGIVLPLLKVGMRLVLGLSILYARVLGHVGIYKLSHNIQKSSVCM